MSKLKSNRLTKAKSLVVEGSGDGIKFYVTSESSKNKKYLVDTSKQTCTCPDMAFRATFCKHLHAAMLMKMRQAKGLKF